MKIFVVIFFISCLGWAVVKSKNLNCRFVTSNWHNLGSIFNCDAKNQGNVIMDRLNRNINSLSGNSNSNPNLKAVYISSSNCFYFPLALQKLAPNLESIVIRNSKLKEIRRDDFTEYKDLRYLDLKQNEIKFLEANLFEFTPILEVVFLHNNKISHIDAHIFDTFVDKLSILYLSNNTCEFEDAFNDKTKVNQIISKVQTGVCKDEAKLITPTTITTTPTVTSAQCEALTRFIEDLNKKLAADKKESMDLQMSLVQELKALRDDMKGQKVELIALKDKLEATETKLEASLKSQNLEIKSELTILKGDFKEVKDQNLEIKAGLGNITAYFEKCANDQFEKRVKFIEKVIGVDPELHNNP